jgi:hypothetical protein
MKTGAKLIISIILTAIVFIFFFVSAFGCGYDNSCPSYYPTLGWILGLGFMITAKLNLMGTINVVVGFISNIVYYFIILSLFTKNN